MIFLGSKVTKEDDSCSNHIIQCMATEEEFDAATLFSKETFLKNFYCDQYEKQDFNFWLEFIYGSGFGYTLALLSVIDFCLYFKDFLTHHYNS